MTPDDAKLVEQARLYSPQLRERLGDPKMADLLAALADAVERLAAERDAADRAEKHVGRAMRDVMADRDRLAAALRELRGYARATIARGEEAYPELSWAIAEADAALADTAAPTGADRG